MNYLVWWKVKFPPDVGQMYIIVLTKIGESQGMPKHKSTIRSYTPPSHSVQQTVIKETYKEQHSPDIWHMLRIDLKYSVVWHYYYHPCWGHLNKNCKQWLEDVSSQVVIFSFCIKNITHQAIITQCHARHFVWKTGKTPWRFVKVYTWSLKMKTKCCITWHEALFSTWYYRSFFYIYTWKSLRKTVYVAKLKELVM